MKAGPVTTFLVAAVVALGAFTGCVPGPVAQPSTPTPVPSPTPTIDLTKPGQAELMVRRLLAAAGGDRLIQVEISATTATITVVRGVETQTWAWRDGAAKQVQSDIQNVNQATFTIDQFNIADVGGLFRAASSISGSESNQELQIVDSSAGTVMMSVSTNPESRTVFFYGNGALLPILDFNTEGGITGALADVMRARSPALRVGVQSSLGVYVDYFSSEETIVRRLRTSQVPVTINERAERSDLPTFQTTGISGVSIWRVLQRAEAAGNFTSSTSWDVVIEDRQGTGQPRMYFTIGGQRSVTDLNGVIVES